MQILCSRFSFICPYVTTLCLESKKTLLPIIASKVSIISIGLFLGVMGGLRELQIINQKTKITHQEYNFLQWKRSQSCKLDLKEEVLEKQGLQARFKKIHESALSAIVFCIPFTSLFLFSNTNTPTLVTSFAIGFNLCIYGKEYYHRHSNAKIKEFVQWLKENPEIGAKSKFDIADYYDYLKYFDLTKLGKEIQENYTRCHTLVFQSYRLTDRDLKNLKQAVWFNQFRRIIFNEDTRYPLQSCPKITMAGLKQVMKAGVQVLKTLDLSQTNLTDEDLIQMADSNCFVHLNKLSIRHNPKITGKGLGYIIEKGFDDLTMLDISGNSQLLGSELDHWVGKKGFNNLTSLELDNTDITETDLERMLNEVEWFGHLEGLKIENSPKLEKIPHNISLLSDQIPSSDAYTPLVGGGVYYHGGGLFIRQCKIKYFINKNPELLKLLKANKVAVGVIAPL